MIQTDQQFPSVGSQTKGLLVNADGSVDIYFGPKPPVGKENNWCRQCLKRVGIRFFGFIARLSLGLIRLGNQERSSYYIKIVLSRIFLDNMTMALSKNKFYTKSYFSYCLKKLERALYVNSLLGGLCQRT